MSENNLSPTNSKKVFTPNFDHRFGGGQSSEEFDITDLFDTISLMCERANAMIMAIQTQFMGSAGMLSNNANFAALDAVSKEIADIVAIVDAFSETS